MITIPAGIVTLGLSRNADEFGWDNEFERYTVDVPAFEIDKYMVTNGQFLDFVNAGRIRKPDLWNDDDWKWKAESWDHATGVLEKRNDAWFYRTMFDEIPASPNWPVYVSHAEASAYAKWAGKALPTEEQWQRAAYGKLRWHGETLSVGPLRARLESG